MNERRRTEIYFVGVLLVCTFFSLHHEKENRRMIELENPFFVRDCSAYEKVKIFEGNFSNFFAVTSREELSSMFAEKPNILDKHGDKKHKSLLGITRVCEWD
jgi:hypothetical protein